MAKNQLAKEIRKARNDGFKVGFQTALDVTTVALNNTDHFGKKRFERLEKEVSRVFYEYGEMCVDSPNYGSSKLKKRLDQIMRR